MMAHDANGRGRYGGSDWLLALLFAAPLIVTLGKLPGVPTASAFAAFFSLTALPAHLEAPVREILFVPLGAFVVVLVRLALGVQVLGLFRPILLAIAFAVIGIPMGLTVLLLVLPVIGLLRPPLRQNHNYARIGILLSLVAALLLLPLMLGRWWHISELLRVAHFPVIALCLTCESFARTVDKEGLGEAAWRTITTIIVAGTIAGVAELGAIAFFLVRPELLLLQAGGILLMSRCFDLRLLEGWNPLAVRSAPGAISVAAGISASPGTPVSDDWRRAAPLKYGETHESSRRL